MNIVAKPSRILLVEDLYEFAGETLVSPYPVGFLDTAELGYLSVLFSWGGYSSGPSAYLEPIWSNLDTGQESIALDPLQLVGDAAMHVSVRGRIVFDSSKSAGSFYAVYRDTPRFVRLDASLSFSGSGGEAHCSAFGKQH